LLASMSVGTNAITLDCLKSDKQSSKYQFVIFNLVLAVVVLIVLLAGLVLNIINE
jgi:hypothetical protein